MAIINRQVFTYSLALALLCATGTAGAQAYSAFSKDSIYGSLKGAESTSFNQAVASVIENPQDNVVQLWTSPVKRRTPITGQVYADGSRQQNGLPCRELHAKLERGPNHENWKFLFCKVDDTWKIASQTQQ